MNEKVMLLIGTRYILTPSFGKCGKCTFLYIVNGWSMRLLWTSIVMWVLVTESNLNLKRRHLCSMKEFHRENTSKTSLFVSEHSSPAIRILSTPHRIDHHNLKKYSGSKLSLKGGKGNCSFSLTTVSYVLTLLTLYMRMYQHWSPPGEHSWKLAIYLVSVL
jgi:hypothetical protein